MQKFAADNFKTEPKTFVYNGQCQFRYALHRCEGDVHCDDDNVR